MNSGNLDCNCYYTVAAGLSNLTTHELVGITDTMQEIGGTVEATLQLLWNTGFVRALDLEFHSYGTLLGYLNSRMLPGCTEKFGLGYSYYPTKGSSICGHMIGLKVWKTMKSELFVRKVDFQLCPEERFRMDHTAWRYVPPETSPFVLIDLNPNF